MANSKQDDQSIHEQSETETGIHDAPHRQSAPGQSSASDWDLNRTKPSGGDAGKKVGSGKPPAQQAPQDGHR
jgi:hypothetical protein